MGGGWGDGKREKERKAVRKGGVGVVGEEGLGALPKRYVPAPCNTVNAEGEGKEQKGGEGEVGARRGGSFSSCLGACKSLARLRQPLGGCDNLRQQFRLGERQGERGEGQFLGERGAIACEPEMGGNLGRLANRSASVTNCTSEHTVCKL